jgi:hypothetical protein
MALDIEKLYIVANIGLGSYLQNNAFIKVTFIG